MALDRGLSKIFHRREQEKKQFQSFLDTMKRAKSRTSFLVQGSPGVGKTTLWEDCCAMVKKQGWKIVLIDRSTLYDLQDFRSRLGRESIWKVWSRPKIPLTTSYDSIRVGTEFRINHHTFLKTLNSLKKLTIIALDEAQKLRNKDLSSDKKAIIGDVLDHLHNNEERIKML
ncbi:MAG: ATP-binding protein [Flavobacteriaceae bacterium]|nr:ATP-binding protein [Flavobacteriaceae bacterium]